ncbi:MAG: alanine--tRNA ligase [Deltaproteobacteria bacterium]|nr:alanine--tRNA ligase [Deltaproteobacteria bacterium]
MENTGAAQVRQLFLDYFARNGHTVVKSSALMPQNDPTLMFTNAGMVQFKDVFVGAETRPYKRACSSQKCMRVSGKHNDLEEVGRTARHHTFFEMLGNFSFGDYFKEEAIHLAWTLIRKEVALDPKRLWVTIFGGEGGVSADTEARALWKKISGLNDDRILDKGMKDNFWAMGDTGPCGPCTEIHYDQGEGGNPSPADFENGRVVEIWNNVFMQFERKPGGAMLPLPKPSVDTGMGLERLSAILQGKRSNYDSDLFAPLIRSTSDLIHKPYKGGDSEDEVSMRVIADHARAAAFLTADGLQPANDGRGYVMRRIMRRAIRHGKRLGFDDLFLHRICDVVVDTMGAAFPELVESRSLIHKVTTTEEKAFRRTLDTGLRILEDELASPAAARTKILSGAAVFKLYDTYGFPKDLTDVIAKERGFHIDEAGFDASMTAQQERSRGSEVGDAAVATVYKTLAGAHKEIEFLGYPHEDEPLASRPGRWRESTVGGARYLEARCKVVGLIQNGATVARADRGEIEVVLDPTPFYGESGGQVGDAGIIEGDSGLTLEVVKTTRPVEGLSVCRGRLRQGAVAVGDEVWAGYDPEVRKQTRAHHSATHLLHAALRQVLGDHVKQAGSLVDPHHLRFDYSHFEAPTPADLAKVEEEANRRVREDAPMKTEVLSFDEAKERGAIALFGEKYGDRVRMVTLGASVELCGGTHARRTRDIDLVLITREEAVAAGVRRIEAEVGASARARATRARDALVHAARIINGSEPAAAGDDQPILQAVAKTVREYDEQVAALKAAGGKIVEVARSDARPPALQPQDGDADARKLCALWQMLVQMTNARATDIEALATRMQKDDASGLLALFARLVTANRDNLRALDQLRQGKLKDAATDLLAGVVTVGDVRLLSGRIDGLDAKALRELADKLKDRLGSGIVCLGSKVDDKANLLVTVSKDLTTRLQAGALVSKLAPHIGGKGGGRPEMASAGGNKPDGLAVAFDRLAEILATPP